MDPASCGWKEVLTCMVAAAGFGPLLSHYLRLAMLFMLSMF